MRISLLLEHYSVRGSGEEDLLGQDVGHIGQQSHCREHNQTDPCFAGREDVVVLAIQLWLDQGRHEVCVEHNDASVVHKQASETCDGTQPVPEDGLQEKLEHDDMDDQGESDA